MVLDRILHQMLKSKWPRCKVCVGEDWMVTKRARLGDLASGPFYLYLDMPGQTID